MSKRFNVNENIEKLYIEIPKALIYESKYRKQEDHKGLSNEAKLLYGILLDKTYLSIFKAREEGNKNFIDENGDAFIYFDNASIEYVLQISNKKAIQVKKELVKFNLLEEVQQGLGFTNRLYLKTVDIDHDKLIQYVDDISAASKATNSVRKLKLKKWREDQSLKCKKYTTVENTTVQDIGNTETIGNALKCKNDITEMYNLHISNTEISNTEINVCMYVDAAQKYFVNSLTSGDEFFINSIVGKIDIDLFERILADTKAKNKTFSYAIGTINNSLKNNITTLDAFLENRKNYKPSNKKVSSSNKSNSNSSVPKVKTRFHNINERFSEYSPEELEKGLKESQKDKFKNKDIQEIDMDAIREQAMDILQERIDADDTIMFKPTVRTDYKLFDLEDKINEICNELLNK